MRRDGRCPTLTAARLAADFGNNAWYCPRLLVEVLDKPDGQPAPSLRPASGAGDAGGEDSAIELPFRVHGGAFRKPNETHTHQLTRKHANKSAIAGKNIDTIACKRP